MDEETDSPTLGNYALRNDDIGQLLISALLESGVATTEEFERAFREAIEEGVPQAADVLRETLDETASEMLDDHSQLIEGFESRLYARWQPALDKLYQVIVISEEVGAEVFNEMHSEAGELSPKSQALIGLHVRSCQVSREVYCLLRGGYPAGALSRWRTLYELSVVATFLLEHDERLAERYLLHSIYMSRKDLRQYQRYCEELGFEPIEPEVVEELDTSTEELRERFGKPFLTRYGWAAEALNNKRPNFTEIAEAVEGMSKLRPFTNLASDVVHAGSKGLSWSLGTPDDAARLHSGASNYGLADPGQLTGNSLTLVTTALVTHWPTVDRLVMARALAELSVEAAESFVSIQRDLESEIESDRESSGNDNGNKTH